MAQAKKKTSTKTAKKGICTGTKKCCKKDSNSRYERYERGQQSNMFFVVTMSVLAASLLFADVLMIMA